MKRKGMTEAKRLQKESDTSKNGLFMRIACIALLDFKKYAFSY